MKQTTGKSLLRQLWMSVIMLTLAQGVWAEDYVGKSYNYTAITTAYPKFARWASNIADEDAQDWYLYPVSGKVINIK